MTSTFGAVDLPPAATGDGIGDPGLTKLLGFCAAVLNADGAAAWAALRPRPAGDTEGLLVVRKAFVANPEEGQFESGDLPSLFAWRPNGRQEDTTLGWRGETSRIQLLWVLPPDDQAKSALRKPFVNGAMKLLGAAIAQGRHPAWVDTTDAFAAVGKDPKAATLTADDDAIAVARPTQTSPLSLSGASLDGVLGGDPLSPRRGLTLTLAPAVGAYNAAAPVVVTYVDWVDNERTVALQPSANGGETVFSSIEAKQVLAVDVPAQVSEAGSFSIGVQPRAGLGSVLLDRVGFVRLELTEWSMHVLPIEVLGSDGRTERTLRYHGALATIVGLEQHDEDPAVGTWPLATPPAGVDIDVNVDGFTASSASFPDDAA
jgi:hypothetical protein